MDDGCFSNAMLNRLVKEEVEDSSVKTKEMMDLTNSPTNPVIKESLAKFSTLNAGVITNATEANYPGAMDISVGFYIPS